jgi:hypothetical protein
MVIDDSYGYFFALLREMGIFLVGAAWKKCCLKKWQCHDAFGFLTLTMIFTI